MAGEKHVAVALAAQAKRDGWINVKLDNLALPGEKGWWQVLCDGNAFTLRTYHKPPRRGEVRLTFDEIVAAAERD